MEGEQDDCHDCGHDDDVKPALVLEEDFTWTTQLPYEITLKSIPNLHDMRSQWRNGMKSVEDVFMEHLQRMNMEFDAKAHEFDGIREKITANYEFLQRWYKDMQRKLMEMNDALNKSRADFNLEKNSMKDLVNMDSEVVPLNVGGTHHLMTERDVLRQVKGSILEKMFNGCHELKKIDDEVFLDRDGKTFLNVVNYLRNDREVFPEFGDKNDEVHFFKELDFWKIDTKHGQPSQTKKTVHHTDKSGKKYHFTETKVDWGHTGQPARMSAQQMRPAPYQEPPVQSQSLAPIPKSIPHEEIQPTRQFGD